MQGDLARQDGRNLSFVPIANSRKDADELLHVLLGCSSCRLWWHLSAPVFRYIAALRHHCLWESRAVVFSWNWGGHNRGTAAAEQVVI